MSAPLDCPGIECWQTLFADTVSPQEREHYERHLESCPTCQERLDGTEECADALHRLAQRVGDPTKAPADPILTQFLERLHEGRVRDAETAPSERTDLYFLRQADRPDVLGLLGGYEIQEVIGQGGMGVVLKALDPALNRVVAIKVMAAAVAGSAVARKRFAREAQAAAAVCHDHIVTVHGVHEADGLPYLVMQYIAGESLQDRLNRCGPLEAAEIVRIGLQTALGLTAAHSKGLIHRDIKPANLLLEGEPGASATGGRVKITDFGLARMIDDVALTQNGVVAGTPEYMAPEQARGETVDHRVDLFSLGSVLYAMCTGVPPFRASTAVAVLRQVSDQVPTPIRVLNPDVPAWLEAFAARLMAKAPGDRFQRAVEVAELLEGYLAHLRQPTAIAAPELPPSPLTPLTARQAMHSRMSTWKWLLLTGVIVTVLGILGAVGPRALTSRGPAALALQGGEARSADSGEPPAREPKHGLVCLLINKNSGRCLSIGDGAGNPGAWAMQGPKPDQAGPAERWTLLRAGTAFRLRNESSLLVLEIGSANRDPGVRAIHWHDHVTRKNQHWTFEPVEGGYLLRVDHSQLVLGIGQGSQAEGARAIQWKQVPDVPDQIWELRPLSGPAGETKTIREAFDQDFRGGRLSADLTLLSESPRAIQTAPEGLRMTLAKNRKSLGPVGATTSFGVRGDFEITATFEILQADEPTGGYGVGPALRIQKVGSAPAAATVARLVRARGRQQTTQVVLWDHQPAPGPNRKAAEGVLPCTASTGRLRLKRVEAVLHYLWAAGTTGGEFEELHHCDFGTDDVERITLLGTTGYKPHNLDVRWLDLRIRGEAPPPEAPITSPQLARELSSRSAAMMWLLATLVVPFSLAVWLVVRQRRRSRKPATSQGGPAAQGASAPAVEPVSFACSACKKKLKARAELAGKKVKCSGCGKAALVPVG